MAGLIKLLIATPNTKHDRLRGSLLGKSYHILWILCADKLVLTGCQVPFEQSQCILVIIQYEYR